jgi:hypothetical protein
VGRDGGHKSSLDSTRKGRPFQFVGSGDACGDFPIEDQVRAMVDQFFDPCGPTHLELPIELLA